MKENIKPNKWPGWTVAVLLVQWAELFLVCKTQKCIHMDTVTCQCLFDIWPLTAPDEWRRNCMHFNGLHSPGCHSSWVFFPVKLLEKDTARVQRMGGCSKFHMCNSFKFLRKTHLPLCLFPRLFHHWNVVKQKNWLLGRGCVRKKIVSLKLSWEKGSDDAHFCFSPRQCWCRARTFDQLKEKKMDISLLRRLVLEVVWVKEQHVEAS